MTSLKPNFYHNKRKDHKKNKSIHEEPQLEVIDPNALFRFEVRDSENRSPLNALENFPTAQKNKKEQIVQMLGGNLDLENLGYISNLIQNRELEEQMKKKARGHQRNKSDINEIRGKNLQETLKPQQEIMKISPRHNENVAIVQSRTPNVRRDTAETTENLEKRKNSMDFNLLNRPEERVSAPVSSPNHEINLSSGNDSAGQRHTPKTNEEKLFGEFLKKNGMNKPNISEKNSGHLNVLNIVNKSGEGFIDNISQYLAYFETSEKELKSNQMTFQDFYSPHKDSNKALKQELEASHNEIRSLKRMVEKLETKLNEMMMVKKKLSHENNSLRQKEESYQHRIIALEEELNAMAQKNKNCQKRLQYTQEMLAKEKIENENNLIALKKVLSEKMEARFSEKNQTANFAGNYVQRAVNHGASKNKQLIDNYLSENYQRIDITNDKFSRSKNVNLSKIDNYRTPNNQRYQEEDSEFGLNDDNFDSLDEEVTNQSHAFSEVESSCEIPATKEQQIQILKDKLHELLEVPNSALNITNSRPATTRNKANLGLHGAQKLIQVGKDKLAREYETRERHSHISKNEKHSKLSNRYILKPDVDDQAFSVHDLRNDSLSLHNSD